MSLIPEAKAGESLRSRPASFRVVDATQRKLVLEIKVYFLYHCENQVQFWQVRVYGTLGLAKCPVVSEACAVCTTIAL